MATTADAPARARPRETWIDVAKGMAIILVALFHSIIFPAEIRLAGPWETPATLLDTFRMPLFFFTAGMFAQKAISKPFAELFWSRMARLIWLFLLWCTIWFVAFQFIPLVGQGQARPTLSSLLLSLVWPNESTWFVYGLAVYFALAWLIKPLPLWAQLAIAFVVVELFGTKLIDSPNGALDKMGMYFLYFLLATKVSAAVRARAPLATWRVTILAFVLYFAAAVSSAKFDFLTAPVVRVVVSLLAITAGCALAVMLSRLRAFDWLRRLGQNTLQVYLVHFYPILIGVALLAPVAGSLHAFAIVVPLVFTAVAIVVSLGVHSLTRRATWLWGLPAPLARLGARAPRQSAVGSTGDDAGAAERPSARRRARSLDT
ncbi:acyltransferase family protein [Frondihabitans peucedani]